MPSTIRGMQFAGSWISQTKDRSSEVSFEDEGSEKGFPGSDEGDREEGGKRKKRGRKKHGRKSERKEHGRRG